jgi:hypothetical protein
LLRARYDIRILFYFGVGENNTWQLRPLCPKTSVIWTCEQSQILLNYGPCVAYSLVLPPWATADRIIIERVHEHESCTDTTARLDDGWADHGTSAGRLTVLGEQPARRRWCDKTMEQLADKIAVCRAKL